MTAPTITLRRPVGPEERALVPESGMRAFPPRRREQPIFCPATSEEYRIKIARDWNVRASGSGYGTRFGMLKSCLDRYKAETAGSRAHQQYRIRAEDLENFGAAIVGDIEITREHSAQGDA
ncbi:ADP-ribosylation/crystallin J1 [Sphingopyxis flava]|uniref:Uncharacterized protein n=1 Tax=Sphingopyxis flava TaxID=1507287 RepID=A0A1T5E2I0_9SPHN|nr:ADP-ribosylation/crystallin J1 [Sphingopyxis flava]SKB78151.1 hypothetical protein SAMN06295937_101839 [Sphingopyxis flava]